MQRSPNGERTPPESPPSFPGRPIRAWCGMSALAAVKWRENPYGRAIRGESNTKEFILPRSLDGFQAHNATIFRILSTNAGVEPCPTVARNNARAVLASPLSRHYPQVNRVGGPG